MKFLRKINLEINKDLYDPIKVKQNDTARYLLFNLLDDRVPFSLENKTVRVYGLKPDGTKVFNNLTIINAAKGLAELQLTTQMLVKPGCLKLELVIYEATDILSTTKFDIDIISCIRDDGAIESTNEFSALTLGLSKLDEWDKYFKETSGAIEEKYTKRLNEIDSSLEEKVNKEQGKGLSTNDYSNEEQIEVAKVKDKASKEELEGVINRIDNIISHNQDVSSNTELIDARVAYDGTIYSTLGTANRTQFKNIISNVENIKDSIYDNTLKPINVRDISGIEKKVNTNCNFQSEGLFIQNLEGYDSYLVHVNCDMEIYTKDIKTQYYSICICNNYNGIIEEHSGYTLYKGENAARYRKSENNLPSVSTKLKVKKGDLIVFTFEKEQSDIIYGFKERDNYVINPIFIEKIRNGLFNGFVEMKNESLEILMKKCKYVFKRVKNENINIDTWRLYGGYLLKEDGTFFTMWENSDAEGVVQLKDEVDFIGGYHGDEKMLSLNIFVDGRKINETSTFEPIPFNSLEIYVESEVFHCGTLTPVFKRNKRLIFKNNILNISNEWTSLEEVTLSSAPLSLFQCFYKENDKEVFTHYSVANDYKLYSLANPDIYPANSIDNKKYSCNTSYGNIRFEVVKTSNQKPFGVVAKNFINSQNRLKLYYYTVYGDTLIKKNETLISEFEIEIV